MLPQTLVEGTGVGVGVVSVAEAPEGVEAAGDRTVPTHMSAGDSVTGGYCPRSYVF